MTQEQYYWFIRSRQILRAYNANRQVPAGDARRSFVFSRPFADNKYLFQTVSDGKYDEDEVAEKFEGYAPPVPPAGCSSARHGDFHGRNYDWYFDQAPTIIVKTPKTDRHRHGTLGVATLMHMKADDVKSGWNEMYGFLECAIVDGMNDAGLVCNLNVCPPGDNPNYPTLEDERRALGRGEPEAKVRNVTYGTKPGAPRRFVGQICRTILDNFATCEEVKAGIDGYSWFAARNPEGEFQEEFHCMVSDKESVLVIEFVENRTVVHEWKKAADGYFDYLGANDPAMSIGSRAGSGDVVLADVQPIMTNFYLSKWDGRLSDLPIDPSIPVGERNPTVTEYGMGYEREATLAEKIGTCSMEELMRSVSYRQIYTSGFDRWTSEFLLRGTALNYRADMLGTKDYLDFRERAKARCLNEDADDLRGIRPEKGVTWQTVHSSTYDLSDKSLVLYSQERYGKGLRLRLDD